MKLLSFFNMRMRKGFAQMHSGAMRGVIAALVLLGVVGFALVQVVAQSDEPAQTESSGSSFATFAGGCFWCMEQPFDETAGVLNTVAGFSGGSIANPSYEEVTYTETGHYEVVQVEYDSSIVSYDELLYIFWRNIDPLNDNGQFCDKGSSYRTAIFFHDDSQQATAQQSLQELDASNRFDERVVTQIIRYEAFYPAEDYHQNYYQTNNRRYKFYRLVCGRDARLKELWGDEAGGGTAH